MGFENYVKMRADMSASTIEYELIGGDISRVSGVEWFNGEGINFNIDNERRISLHKDDIHALSAIALSMGMIDLKAVKVTAKKLKMTKLEE